MDRAVDDHGKTGNWTPAVVAKAKRICYRTVWCETDWLIYTNVGVPESATIYPNDGPPSHGGDLNSVGLYQQRSPWWWTDGDRASIAAAMSPYLSTVAFLVHMALNTPRWWEADESAVCQWTQRSQFDSITIDPKTGKPYPFAANYRERGEQTDALAVDHLFFTHQEERRKNAG